MKRKKEPQLVLVKSIAELTRPELEAFIASAQAKRLAAAIVYHQTRAAKLEGVNTRTQERIEREMELLFKALGRLDAALDAVDGRMQKIQQLEHEAGLMDDQIEELKKVV